MLSSDINALNIPIDEKYKEPIFELIGRTVRRLLRYILPEKLYNYIFIRHNRIKMKYLDGGWCDRDEQLIHAMFQVLNDYIEKEKPDEIVNWDSCSEHKQAWDEMQVLYKWWNNDRQLYDKLNPLYQDNIPHSEMVFTPIPDKPGFSTMTIKYNSKEDEILTKKIYEESEKYEENCHKKDEEMMNRLIKIRRFMWT